MKIRPQRLSVGDTVGVVALSGPLAMEYLPEKIALLEGLGLRVKIGESVGLTGKYLAGKDEERLNDLHKMIQDPEVKGIFCLKGGYGAARIADRIDYQSLTENPKIFWGFSDVTYLHTAFQEYSNIVTFHGPMLSSGGANEFSELSKRMFQQLFSPFEIQYDENLTPLQTLVQGNARGELTGGNLNRLVSTLGTKFEIDTKGKIVLLEDIGESIENIDSMLNQLRLARKLEEAAGFVIGNFTAIPDGILEDVWSLLEEYLKPLAKPTVAGFMIGHCEPNIGIPLGVEVILDADLKMLRILPGVE
ncbi:S66 peptidase family protein [Ureibacillus chungkukjangi]|uniref:Muramoyltetrapeptide carboxypeptidase n=1 Tax=Ureibacillus chungkukjangi TaxID=1202712 RepID=A0A318THT3_9BACL|nr:LD-carboxypeptidase [Ureibacillus chungkukjangi]MCM3389440.1 LD-carboxypeptidase [Ureibacillus chungkukjangi]PYF04244.1 muramoyltetrapeptide carboxypeptidase [Ureibacillus chungkukjangi]